MAEVRGAIDSFRPSMPTISYHCDSDIPAAGYHVIDGRLNSHERMAYLPSIDC